MFKNSNVFSIKRRVFMSGRLIFTFVSLADRFDENGAATYGMQRLHLAVHKHDIPITWIVSSG